MSEQETVPGRVVIKDQPVAEIVEAIRKPPAA